MLLDLRHNDLLNITLGHLQPDGRDLVETLEYYVDQENDLFDLMDKVEYLEGDVDALRGENADLCDQVTTARERLKDALEAVDNFIDMLDDADMGKYGARIEKIMKAID